MPREQAPSAWQIERAMTTLLAARARLMEEDPDLAEDDRRLEEMDTGTADAMEVLRNVVRAAIHAKDMVEAADKRATEVMLRRDRFKRRHDYLRMAAFSAMDALGLPRLIAEDFTVSVKSNPPTLVLSEDAVLDDEYIRITRAPDKLKIREALLDGVVIEGAMLSNGVPSISIRTK